VFQHIEIYDFTPIPVNTIKTFLTQLTSLVYPVAAHCAAGFGRTGFMILSAIACVLGVSNLDDVLSLIREEYTNDAYKEHLINMKKSTYQDLRPTFEGLFKSCPVDNPNLVGSRLRPDKLLPLSIRLLKKWNPLNIILKNLSGLKKGGLESVCNYFVGKGIAEFEKNTRSSHSDLSTGSPRSSKAVVKFGRSPSFGPSRSFQMYDVIICLQQSYTENNQSDYRHVLRPIMNNGSYFVHFPINDHSILNDDHLINLVAFIITCLSLHLHVYFHCFSGHGRSGSVFVNLQAANKGKAVTTTLETLCDEHKKLGHTETTPCCFINKKLEMDEQLHQAYRLQPMFLIYYQIKKKMLRFTGL
jgi:protein-tyrosine phosphatase